MAFVFARFAVQVAIGERPSESHFEGGGKEQQEQSGTEFVDQSCEEQEQKEEQDRTES